MMALRGLWLGGAARPVARAADEDASVGPITEGARPVASAAGRDASAVGPVAKASQPASCGHILGARMRNSRQHIFCEPPTNRVRRMLGKAYDACVGVPAQWHSAFAVWGTPSL